MKLKNSNITTEYVDSGFSSNRDTVYFKVDDDSVDNDLSDEEDDGLNLKKPRVEIEGKEGLYQQKYSVIDRYVNSRVGPIPGKCPDP